MLSDKINFKTRTHNSTKSTGLFKRPVILLYLICVNILIAEEWQWQTPQPQGNSLNDIHAFDENTIIAIGNDNTIIKTTDGGQTWDLKESGLSVYDQSSSFNSMFFVDDKTGWIIGRYGLILNTTDGGENWAKQTSPNSSSLRSVFFLDQLNGWITTNDGCLLHTTDGGNMWQSKDLEGWTSYIDGIQFINEYTGWLLAYSREEEISHLLMTQDGGASWQDILNTETINLYSHLQFFNDKIGWVVGYIASGSNAGQHPQEFGIYKTTDGGQNWTKQYSNGTGALVDLHVMSDTEVWAIGKIGPFLKSMDGGETWKVMQEASDEIFYTSSIHFSDINHGWIAGAFGAIYKTSDGGQYWELLRKGPKHRLESVYFIDQNNGWSAGWQGTIINTIDGGATWRIQDSGTHNALKSIMFIDKQNGWSVGGYGEIIHTENGGETWNRQYGETKDHLESVFFIDDNTGWAAGYNNSGNAIIMSTVNGGLDWNQLQVGIDNVFWDIYFVTNKIGWAIGYSYLNTKGIILKTTDGGGTWQNQDCDAVTHLESISFIDSLTGWAVGGAGTILKTIDGGDHWIQQVCPIPGNQYAPWLHSVSFSNALEGCAVGEFVVIKTIDSGQNWMPIEVPTLSVLEDVCIINSTLWIAGGKGNIFSTNSGSMNNINIWQYKNDSRPVQNTMLSNYPNPFNSLTRIYFTLIENTDISLQIFNIRGQLVQDLFQGNLGKGEYNISWNAETLPTGVYLLILNTGAYSIKKQSLLLK